jgi:hypothetical protein
MDGSGWLLGFTPDQLFLFALPVIVVAAAFISEACRRLHRKSGPSDGSST